MLCHHFPESLLFMHIFALNIALFYVIFFRLSVTDTNYNSELPVTVFRKKEAKQNILMLGSCTSNSIGNPTFE